MSNNAVLFSVGCFSPDCDGSDDDNRGDLPLVPLAVAMFFPTFSSSVALSSSRQM